MIIFKECRHTRTLVVDCSRDVFREHCYWPIVSDLINILAHKSVARAVFDDQRLLLFWFELLAYFQGQLGVFEGLTVSMTVCNSIA